MKRIILSAICMICILCTGCAPSPAEEAADNFFTCMENGYLDTAVRFVSEEVKEQFSQYLSSDESMDEMIRTIIANAFKDHKITYAKRINENEYELTVTAHMLNSDEIEKLTGSLDIMSFYKTLKEEAETIRDEEGEEAMQAFVKEKTAAYITASLNAYFVDYSYPERRMRVRVENDSEWLITEISTE